MAHADGWKSSGWKPWTILQKQKYAAARYIIVIYIGDDTWNHTQFIADFKRSDCYANPLKLEEGNDDTFLENEFTISDAGIQYWLKNTNTEQCKIWRYQHINSYTPYKQKRSTLIATLKKVDRMASDATMRYYSAHDKLHEFTQLGYPDAMLKYACQRIGRETGHAIWFQVAKDHI